MAQTLRNLGFEVISTVDTNRITLSRAVRDFGRALRRSGKDTVGLFYYAGHGVQARGENYLIPLGAEVEDEADLEIEAITASVVLNQMEAAGNTLNLVVLDACRNNPYQAKLTRVGCDPGAIDGQWGSKGRRTLVLFKRYASLRLPYEYLSPEVIKSVKQQSSRVCPKVKLVKDKKTRVRNTKKAVKSKVISKPVRNRKKSWAECEVEKNGGLYTPVDGCD